MDLNGTLPFRDSQGREGTVELSPTETVYVGRGLECAIRTDDGMVSRRHSQIRMEGGRYVVEDLGSANGTHLNNTRVQKQALGHTDVVQCGSLMIRFVDEGARRTSSPQPMRPPAAPRRRRRRAARWCSSATTRRRCRRWTGRWPAARAGMSGAPSGRRRSGAAVRWRR